MRILALGCVLAALVLGAAQPAAASTVETDCANLATTLAAATTGETIVLSGMCSGTEGSFGLPEVAALTIEGAPSGVNGFDGTGAFGAALFSGSEGTDGLTLRNLTFRNYEGFQGAVWIKSSKSATHPFAFIGDRFLNNVDTSSNGGGLSMIVEEPKPSVCAFTGTGAPVTLTESVFTGNTDHSQAGGGAYLDLECAAGTISASVTNNVFTANKVAAGTEPLQGGGLWVGLGHEIIAVPFALSQSGNLLEGNAVENTSSEARRVEGGGEFTDGGAVTSLDDRFIANSISGAKGSAFSSEGGGFASLDPGECSATPGVSSTATNLIATGNSIGAPSGSGTGGEGGGVYVGCLPGKGGYHLTLLDSTITANSASGSGASAGLDGETNDTAVLENSIVTGNLGAQELGGFGAVDGEHLTASFSDVCALGSSTSPFAGAGDICAAPALVDASGGDVRETAASPTIDAGSNALAGSLATDAFGGPRITAGRAGDAAIVDIGASESAAVATPAGPVEPIRSPSPSPFGTATASRLKAVTGGISVTLSCAGATGQTCSGSLTLQTIETVRGKRVLRLASASTKPRKRPVTVGSATYNGLKAGASVTLTVKLNATGRKLLRRFPRLPVRVLVTEKGSGPAATIATARLTIRAPRPKHKR